MNVGILLITHGNIGVELLDNAIAVLGACPLNTATLTASQDCDPETVFSEALGIAGTLNQGDGVLVLTDLFGATPCNIACRLQEQLATRVVTGVNLPMLIRVLNYPRLNLEELTEKAISGGRDGVQQCKPGQKRGK